MKSVTVSCCILLVCSLFACSKNKDNGQPLPPPPVDTTVEIVTDTLPKYAPGDTLIIIGDTSNGDETVLILSGRGGNTMPNYKSIAAIGSAYKGIVGMDRSIIKFGLRDVVDSSRDTLPPIQKAVLYLYQYSFSTKYDPYTDTAQQNGNNAMELHRITGDWQASTLSWSTQPTLAKGSANALEDVVTVPAIAIPLAAGTTDDVQIDITDMMRKILESGENKGFLLKMSDERANAARSYGSFSCPDNGKRPKLVIYF